MRARLAVVLGLLVGPAVAAPPASAPVPDGLERAIALLGSPAASGDDVRRAKAELGATVAAGGDGDAVVAALYLLGRLEQLSEGTAVPREFETLWREHAGHPLAQLATLKSLLRRLYAEGAEAAEDRLAAGEEGGATITVPDLRRDYHLAMGEAYIFHGDRRGPALRHLRAARALGIPSAATRADVLVQIGELARLTGDRAGAAESYRAFLAEFPRDLRQQIVRDHLATVEGAAP